MKKFEIALFYGSEIKGSILDYDDIRTLEYNTQPEMLEDLLVILNSNDKDLCLIELSILDQTEEGENENYYIFAKIDYKEYSLGNENCI